MRAQAEEEAEQLNGVYVRVKRAKATYFLHVDLQQTTLEVKAMLQDLTQRVRLWCLLALPPGTALGLHALSGAVACAGCRRHEAVARRH